MARVERIRVYPVKGLDGIEVTESTVCEGGTLAHDREFALFDVAGEVVNGKRTDRVHRLDTEYEPDTRELTVRAPDGSVRTFDLDAERDRAADWFGEFFDLDLTMERDGSLGYVDRRELGPSIVSTATLREVASWFDDLSVESVRRRLRANVEIGGVPPFWEDRLVGADAPTVVADEVRIEGATPCGRCVVPARDPDTGEALPEFRERFVTKRRETFPDWADDDAFDHFYTLMVIGSVPRADRGETLRVGDSVDLS